MNSGTESAPNDASLTVGYAGSESRLDWREGRLTVSGTIFADAGTIGGFSISNNRLESNNGNVVLVAEATDEFGEGLSLVAGTADTAGAIKWYASATSNTAYGIDLCYADIPNNQIVKKTQVSDGGGSGGPECYYIITVKDVEYIFNKYGTFSADSITTRSIGTRDPDEDLTIEGYESGHWLTPGDVVQYNGDGLASRMSKLTNGRGIVAQLILNTDIAVQLRLPTKLTGSFSGVELTKLTFTYFKKTSGAYFTTAKLIYYNRYLLDAQSTLITMADVGKTETHNYVYTATVLATTDEPLFLDQNGVCYLVLTTTGIANPGDLEFIQGEVLFRT